MSWRARVRMMVLFVVLGVVFAAQTMAALIPFRQSFCDQPSCGCPLTHDGQTLLTYYCACIGSQSERSCTYG